LILKAIGSGLTLTLTLTLPVTVSLTENCSYCDQPALPPTALRLTSLTDILQTGQVKYIYSIYSAIYNLDCIKAASQYQSKHNNNVRFLVETFGRADSSCTQLFIKESSKH